MKMQRISVAVRHRVILALVAAAIVSIGITLLDSAKADAGAVAPQPVVAQSALGQMPATGPISVSPRGLCTSWETWTYLFADPPYDFYLVTGWRDCWFTSPVVAYQYIQGVRR